MQAFVWFNAGPLFWVQLTELSGLLGSPSSTGITFRNLPFYLYISPVLCSLKINL